MTPRASVFCLFHRGGDGVMVGLQANLGVNWAQNRSKMEIFKSGPRPFGSVKWVRYGPFSAYFKPFVLLLAPFGLDYGSGQECDWGPFRDQNGPKTGQK